MEKKCCFIGHRKIERTEDLIKRIDGLLERLITEKGVETFLFGSRSEFDSLCHERVTKMQNKYPAIKRIMFACRSEYAVKKEEKAKLQKSWSAILKKDVRLKDYDGMQQSERINAAGRAAYVERNQAMINASEYCVFYYNPYYQPPKNKGLKGNASEYQPKSGTKLAFDYACQKRRNGKTTIIVNLCLDDGE
ncbi:MAG: DUF1273 family protein [Clostridia bacterium]|nr:DUF1273 family protein [Clostridia bacterium]